MNFLVKDKATRRDEFEDFQVSFFIEKVIEIEYGFCLHPVDKDK